MKNKVKIGETVRCEECIAGQYYKIVNTNLFKHVHIDIDMILICNNDGTFRIIITRDKLDRFHIRYNYIYHTNDTFKRVRKPNIK